MTEVSNEAIETAADVYARWRQEITTDEIPALLRGAYEASLDNARLFIPGVIDALVTGGHYVSVEDHSACLTEIGDHYDKTIAEVGARALCAEAELASAKARAREAAWLIEEANPRWSGIAIEWWERQRAFLAEETN